MQFRIAINIPGSRMPKYSFPTPFSSPKAQELAALVNAAYAMLNSGNWAQPQGYNILAKLAAKEIWKGIGPLSNFVGPVLQPVPFGFVASRGSDLFVVLRGTKTPLEWFDDITAFPVTFKPNGQNWGQITQGFSLLYHDLGPQILKVLGDFKNSVGSLSSIYVTGHSLGAALAHIAAAGIYTQFSVQPTSYTFSGPRAGDHGFAAAYEASKMVTWRIFNTEDIVPTVPPAAIQMANPNMGMHGLTPVTQALSSLVALHAVGYQHVGYPIGVTFHRDAVADNHEINALVQELVS